MQVQHILKSKGMDTVFWVSPGTLVSEAMSILAEKKIGTVVVSSDGDGAEGILSERDIVRELARQGAACLSTPVSAVMTAAP